MPCKSSVLLPGVKQKTYVKQGRISIVIVTNPMLDLMYGNVYTVGSTLSDGNNANSLAGLVMTNRFSGLLSITLYNPRQRTPRVFKAPTNNDP